jgi:hypothetical protein
MKEIQEIEKQIAGIQGRRVYLPSGSLPPSIVPQVATHQELALGTLQAALGTFRLVQAVETLTDVLTVAQRGSQAQGGAILEELVKLNRTLGEFGLGVVPLTPSQVGEAVRGEDFGFPGSEGVTPNKCADTNPEKDCRCDGRKGRGDCAFPEDIPTINRR